MTTARTRAATMADVARAAGVSRTTVSLVLNEQHHIAIAASTRARVLEVARAVGYRPNAAARALVNQSTGWIGLVTEIVTAPYAVDIIKGAQQRSWEDGNFLLIAPSDDEISMEAAAIEKLLEQRVDGLLIAATWHRAISVPGNAHQVPCVLVNCFDAEGVLPSIVPDEVAGGRTAARVLLEAGHRRIGHITLTPGIPAQVGRLEGLHAELTDAGLTLDDSLVIPGDGEAESGYAAAATLLDSADPPTAIFCGNDRMAMGAYDAIKERGLRIGTDVSIVGFDDQDILAAHLRPDLTTVALPFERMGAHGVSMLASLTAGRPIAQEHLTIACPLHQRSSVGIAPR